MHQLLNTSTDRPDMRGATRGRSGDAASPLSLVRAAGGAGSVIAAAMMTFFAAASASGQQTQPVAVKPDQVVILEARLGDRAGDDPTDCAQISSHSDFTNYQNPVGQSVYAQAGFAQGEWTAQTYTIPASSFPLRISTIETIFVTANSSVQTTTHWTVAVWEGTPQNGALVAQYSSDGVTLPHLVLPPGNAAGSIQFGIDPSYPEQIIVQDDGTSRFSIGFRIDQHNSPPGNNCDPPPQCCNAFPATDLGPLGSATGNWVFGLSCPLSCIPGGGWVRFSDLASICRPSGDWILRATWAPISCTPGIGACCLPNGTCEIISDVNCSTQGGIYQGDGTNCASVVCPQPTGACCFANGSCLNLTQANCATAGGTWLGGGTQCNSGQCPTGACCLPGGNCVDGLTLVDCQAQSGAFQGVGSECAQVSCPQPTGACCTATGGCLDLTQADCGVIPEASWKGAFTECGPQPHTVCCYANCTGSTQAPLLSIDDFICFINEFSIAQSLPVPEQIAHYANCDGSTTEPVLTIDDFICFINEFAAGCD